MNTKSIVENNPFRIMSYTLLVVTGCTSFSSGAVDLYRSDTQKLELHGQGIFIWNNHVRTYGKKAESLGHRFRLVYKYQLNDEWSAGFDTEWAYDPFYHQGELAATKRFLFYKLKSNKWGEFRVGQQKSLIFTMVGTTTDRYIGYGTKAQGTFNGYGNNTVLGYARPNRSVAWYSHSTPVEFGLMYGYESGHINYGAAEHLTTEEYLGRKRNYFLQAGGVWKVDKDWALRMAYGYTDMTTAKSDGYGGSLTVHPNVNGWLAGVTYDKAPWYHAVVYGEFRNLNSISTSNSKYKNARGLESYSGYTFNEIPPIGFFKVYGGVNHFEDKESLGRISYLLSGVALITLKDHLAIALEKKIDFSRSKSGNKNGTDDYQLTAKYYF